MDLGNKIREFLLRHFVAVVSIFLLLLAASYLPAPYSPLYWIKRAVLTETALCRDGVYSFSSNRSGTCSNHGGVARWLGR